MKSIEIDDDLYAFIASQTKHIGESASQILRRLLLPEDGEVLHGATAASDALELTVVSEGDKSSDNNNGKVPSAKSSSDDAQQVNAKSLEKKVSSVTPSSSVATGRSSAKSKPAAIKASVSKASAQNAANAKTAVAKQPDAASEPQSTASTNSEVLSHDKNDILELVSNNALSTFTKRVDQFLFVLSAAHKLNADSFERVESIKGKNRTYFATSKEALLENGSSTNPKAIPDSAYWVVTNNNTAKKVSMLEQVLRQLGYTPEIIASVVARFSSEGK
ncbi:SeqA protein [Alteromonas sp. BMJM2]|uniref:SeqA protein n=1 Tax=Alteromonas sp. BMJM2 TaxID=2954241 RepID=UPI0022B46F2E|nr:SeqA protein [Alteromonas sp. BMJM2]